MAILRQLAAVLAVDAVKVEPVVAFLGGARWRSPVKVEPVVAVEAVAILRPLAVAGLDVVGLAGEAVKVEPVVAVVCGVSESATLASAMGLRQAYFWTRDRAALTLKTCQRRETSVEVVPPEAREAMRSNDTVNLLAADVRALFEGPVLDRAHRRAALLPIQFAIIFGRAVEDKRGEAPHYRQAMSMRKIGRTITHPNVVAALAEAPFWVLEAAARETDPERQVRAATQARIDRLDARAPPGE